MHVCAIISQTSSAISLSRTLIRYLSLSTYLPPVVVHTHFDSADLLSYRRCQRHSVAIAIAIGPAVHHLVAYAFMPNNALATLFVIATHVARSKR